MLRKAKDIHGYKLGARDGEVGRIKDLYFEDQNWTVRYVVADTNTWLLGRKVLLSPYAFRGFRDTDRVLDVDLTKDQIRSSPSIDEDMPVSRQFELQYYTHYNWPYYWQGPALWGPGPLPVFDNEMAQPGVAGEQTPSMTKPSGDPHLRSARALHGYVIHASDGNIGEAVDLLIDDQDWKVRYLEVDTGNWLPGKKVLVSPEWIRGLDWQESSVIVDLDRASIQNAPEYKADTVIDREYERRLHEHYRRGPYWDQKLAA